MKMDIDWDIKDGVIDALTDREAEYKAGRNNGEIYDRLEKSLINERKDNEDEDLTDFVSDWADSRTEIYTTAIFSWYAQDANRYAYADDAISEFGHSDSVVKELQQGIYKFLEEWAYSVLEPLESIEETEEVKA